MKTWICTTFTNFFWPLLGPARLKAYVNSQGFDVSLKDFNQDAYFTLLSKEYLERHLVQLQYKIDPLMRSSALRNNLGSILLNSSNGEFKRILRDQLHISCNSDNAVYKLLEAKDQLLKIVERSRVELDGHYMSKGVDHFLKHFKVLQCGKAIIDATFFPANLDFGFGFHGTEYGLNVNDILKVTTDFRHNYLLPYFENEVMPQFETEQPEIVGLSLTHSSDFYPAFTLANMLKAANPDVHICLGGSTLTEVAYKIERNPRLWNYFDSMISGPGEVAFTELISALQNKKDLSEVPNLVYKKGARLVKSLKSHTFDINDAKTPEFALVRPGSPIPVEASNNCYWGKCIFCYYPKMGLSRNNTSCAEPNRERSIERVLEDIRTLKVKHNPMYFLFTDSSLHPERMEQIVNRSKEEGLDFQFQSFFRFEKELKSKEFCKRMALGGFLGGQVGLESGSQRINNIINKGVKVEDAELILKNLYEAGILVHVYSIVGVPGEKVEDSELTYEFIKKVHKYLTLDWQTYSFLLLENGPIAQRLADFKMTARPLPNDILTQIMEYDVEDGISEMESLQLSIEYNERLKKFRNPLYKLMDIESYKVMEVSRRAYAERALQVKKTEKIV